MENLLYFIKYQKKKILSELFISEVTSKNLCNTNK